MRKAILALADGTVFDGFSFGAEGTAAGEVVFNTSMTGYQEVLTDPSYNGQIVAMTYSHQGNYGVNEEDIESLRPWVEGFIVKEPCLYPSSWRSREGIAGYLKRHGIVGVSGIDTRALTRIIRDKGAMMAVVSTEDLDPAGLVKKAKSAPTLVGRDLVKEVTCSKPYTWHEELWRLEGGYAKTAHGEAGEGKRYKVAAYDYGIKRNILRNLYAAGCD